MAISAEQAVALIDTLRAQVEELAESLDQSRHEMGDLRLQTDRSISHLQEQCDRAKRAARVDEVEHAYMRLVDEKANRPPVFDGNRKEIRGWSRSVKAYLDSKYPGFRKILTIIDWAEAKSSEQELISSGWK